MMLEEYRISGRGRISNGVEVNKLLHRHLLSYMLHCLVQAWVISVQSCSVTPGMCSRTAVGEGGVERSSPKTFGRGNSQLVDAAESSCSESEVLHMIKSMHKSN